MTAGVEETRGAFASTRDAVVWEAAVNDKLTDCRSLPARSEDAHAVTARVVARAQSEASARADGTFFICYSLTVGAARSPRHFDQQ